MPRLRAPVDPYCRLNGRGKLVKHDDANPDLAELVRYARAFGVQVWRYADDKLALTSKLNDKILGVEDAPLVFGGEGQDLGRTAASAFAALHEQSYTMQRMLRGAEQVERQARNRRLEPQYPPVDPLDIVDKAVGGEVGDVVRTFNGLPSIDEVSRDLTGRRALGGSPLIAIESALMRLGDGAAVMAQLFRRGNELRNRIEAIAFTRLQAQAERLTAEERAGGYQRYVERGELADPSRRAVLDSVYANINEVDNWFYDTARGLGLDVKPKVGAGTLNPTGNYFPHKRDWGALKDPNVAKQLIFETQQRAREAGVDLTPEQALAVLNQHGFGDIQRETAIRKLMNTTAQHSASGAGLDYEAATRLFDTIIERRTERLSGNLEHSRLFDAEGYITDFTRAYTATWSRNAHRIAEVATYGPKDERIWRLLDQMRANPTMPASAHKFAKSVYDLEVGRTRVEFGSLARDLYALEGAKLSLSVLANSFQGLNTLMRVGLSPFMRAMGEALRNPRRFARLAGPTLATDTGALPVMIYGSDATRVRLPYEMLSDIRDQGMTAMLGRGARAIGEPAGKALDFVLGGSLAAFRYVENFNRSLAQRAGEIYVEQLETQLRLKGEAGLTHRKVGQRIRELDLAPEAMLRAIRAGDDTALREMRTLGGLRISDETQFRANYQQMPLYATSELGKFAFQFKNYSYGQTRFMAKNLSPKMARRDPERFVRTLATIGLAYPAVGIALTSLRQDLMGPTLAGEQLAEALEDPTFANVVWAGTIGMTMAGGLGIIGDIGMTAFLGNDFALRSFTMPPIASSFVNWTTLFGSAARGAVNGDPNELRAGRAAALRELGGLGGAVEEALRRREGTAEEPIDPIEAIFGSSPFSR